MSINRKKINFRKFVKQKRNNYCILACIESVLRDFGVESWDQDKIKQEFIENFERDSSYYLIQRIIDETDLRNKFECEFRRKYDFNNNSEYFKFIDNHLAKNIPVFVSMKEIILIAKSIKYKSLWESEPYNIYKPACHSVLIFDKIHYNKKIKKCRYLYFDPNPHISPNYLSIPQYYLIENRADDWNIAILRKKN